MLERRAEAFVLLRNSVCVELGSCCAANSNARHNCALYVERHFVDREKRDADNEDKQAAACSERRFLVKNDKFNNNHKRNAAELGELVETDGVHFEVEIHENNSAYVKERVFPALRFWNGGSSLKESHAAHHFKQSESHEKVICC